MLSFLPAVLNWLVRNFSVKLAFDGVLQVQGKLIVGDLGVVAVSDEENVFDIFTQRGDFGIVERNAHVHKNGCHLCQKPWTVGTKDLQH